MKIKTFKNWDKNHKKSAKWGENRKKSAVGLVKVSQNTAALSEEDQTRATTMLMTL